MKKILLAVAAVLAVGAYGCGSSSSSSSSEALEGLASCTAQSSGSVICGTVYAVDGVTPVANATVTRLNAATNESVPLKGITGELDENGLVKSTASSTECKTDSQGSFACWVKNYSGSGTFQILGGLFSSALQFNATCTDGATTQIPKADTTGTSSQTAGVKWLVIPGAFDGIQLLLSQLKGCTLTGDVSTPAELTSSASCVDAGLTVLTAADVESTLTAGNLSTYRAIFVNCAADYSSNLDVTTALQSYVSGGGNIYFSDLSDSWLTAVFPNLITYPSDKNSTNAGTLAAATVKDSSLQIFLGTAAAPLTTMSIEFNLGVWSAMQSVVSGWTTFIEGDISSLAPTLTGTRPITVGGPSSSGCIFYTSYHVETGVSSGADQEKALKYLVMNKMSNCR